MSKFTTPAPPTAEAIVQWLAIVVNINLKASHHVCILILIHYEKPYGHWSPKERVL